MRCSLRRYRHLEKGSESRIHLCQAVPCLSGGGCGIALFLLLAALHINLDVGQVKLGRKRCFAIGRAGSLTWIQHSAPLILATVVWRRGHFASLRLGLGARAEEGAQKWNSGSRLEDDFGSRSRRRDELGTDGGESDEG